MLWRFKSSLGNRKALWGKDLGHRFGGVCGSSQGTAPQRCIVA